MKFRATVEKYASFAAEYWTNIYWLESDGLADAAADTLGLVNAEKALYTNSVTITKVRVDDGLPDTDVVETVVYGTAGTRPTTGLTNIAPLFVVVRVDFGITGSGHPSRKYLRGVLYEEDFGAINYTGAMPALANTYGAAIVALNVIDPQGSNFANYSVHPAPTQRQLRRGSKKKTTP